MKNPNGFGGVRKLAGRRRHPYQAVVSAGHEIRNNKICVKQVSLGCYATRREAMAALAEWQVSHTRIDLKYMTVSDVWKKIKPNLKESAIHNFVPIYNRYAELHETRLTDLKTYTIEQIPLPPLSNSSHDKIRAFWHAIFEYGLANDIINKDYSQFIKFHDVKPRKHKEVFTSAEISRCKEVPLYKILLYTGMRIGELLAMKTKDVYEEDGILCFHVLKSKTESGKRIIPVHHEIIDLIDFSEEYVVEHKTYNKTRDEFKEFDLGSHVIHDFRRTFASYAKSCGCDEFYTKCLMGHVHNDITHDVYTQAFVHDLQREIEKIKM